MSEKDGMPKTATNVKTGTFGTVSEIWTNLKGVKYVTVHSFNGKVNWKLSNCKIEG